MSAHDELEEHVHHAEEPFDKIVAATMAIMAAVLAVVSVLGQHFIAKELLMQAKASDQWAYYQAKDIRRFTAEATRDILAELKQGSAAAPRYNQQAAKYKSDATGIQNHAREFEEESERNGKKARRFHTGEIFLEVAIVFSSLAILSKVRLIYFVGILSAVVGLVVSVTAWMV